jgi:hypothetical protein
MPSVSPPAFLQSSSIIHPDSTANAENPQENAVATSHSERPSWPHAHLLQRQRPPYLQLVLNPSVEETPQETFTRAMERSQQAYPDSRTVPQGKESGLPNNHQGSTDSTYGAAGRQGRQEPRRLRDLMPRQISDGFVNLSPADFPRKPNRTPKTRAQMQEGDRKRQEDKVLELSNSTLKEDAKEMPESTVNFVLDWARKSTYKKKINGIENEIPNSFDRKREFLTILLTNLKRLKNANHDLSLESLGRMSDDDWGIDRLDSAARTCIRRFREALQNRPACQTIDNKNNSAVEK